MAHLQWLVTQDKQIEYTHWLVTRGEEPDSINRPHAFVPIVLLPMTAGRKELHRAVVKEVERRTRLLLKENATSFDALIASIRPYALDLTMNLWIRDVRLVSEFDRGRFTNETAIVWTLVGSRAQIAYWQGAADGVIPPETPVTLTSPFSRPSPYIIFDL